MHQESLSANDIKEARNKKETDNKRKSLFSLSSSMPLIFLSQYFQKKKLCPSQLDIFSSLFTIENVLLISPLVIFSCLAGALLNDGKNKKKKDKKKPTKRERERGEYWKNEDATEITVVPEQQHGSLGLLNFYWGEQKKKDRRKKQQLNVVVG